MANEVTLQGKIVQDFAFNHEVMNERFFMAYLSMYRTSGTEDIIPIMVSEKLFDPMCNHLDEYVLLHGQFRSHNYFQDDGNHILLYAFAQQIEFMQDSYDQNIINLDGFICKQPTFRTTPFGREVSDIILAVPRLCGKSDYIPCICWGRNAHFASKKNVGDQVQITGRIQSREYAKVRDGIEEKRIAYEVSVKEIST